MSLNPGRSSVGFPGYFYDYAMTRRTLTSIFVASALALVALTAAYLLSSEPLEVGDIATIEASLGEPTTTTQAPEPETVEPVSMANSEIAPPSTVPIWSGRLAAAPSEDVIFPVTLKVNSIEVEAPITPTGVDHRTGQMAVPSNIRDVAWYEYGSRPGEDGSAVLAAHVDLASQGPGVFFNLRDIDRGDLIDVEFSDGSVRHFRVEARTIYEKAELPLDTIFAKDGSPVLTLITCGGRFSESSGSYDSNVVVYAIPVPDRDLGSAR